MRTIRSKLLVLSAMSVAPAVVVAALMFFKLSTLSSAIDSGSVYREAIRNFMELDMMHDAIRGDVLLVVSAKTPEERDEVRKDLAGHIATMESMFEALESAKLNPGDHTVTLAAKPQLQEYTRGAQEIVRMTESEPERVAGALKTFQTTFEVLEAANEKVSERLAAGARGDYASEARFTRWVAVAAAFIGLVASLFISGAIGRSISRRINDVSKVLAKVATGDFTTRIDSTGDESELGKMSSDLNLTLDQLAKDFTLLRTCGLEVAAAAEQVRSLSAKMSTDASTSTQQANAVATASDQVSQNVTAVAAATEEMSATIQQIAQSASQAARVATSGVSIAAATNETVTKLGDSSTEIEGVVKLIGAIADQTHLLALNASIEAARAGDAGRGFAVVAGEVKELAGQTTRATKEIAKKISGIQSEIRDAVGAIAKVGDVIGNINELQQTIASAVEEQAATTNEMGRNVSIAATATSDIARSTSTAVGLSGGVTSSAESSHAAANRLAALAYELGTVLTRYRVAEQATERSNAPRILETPPVRPVLSLVPPSSSNAVTTAQAA